MARRFGRSFLFRSFPGLSIGVHCCPSHSRVNRRCAETSTMADFVSLREQPRLCTAAVRLVYSTALCGSCASCGFHRSWSFQRSLAVALPVVSGLSSLKQQYLLRRRHHHAHENLGSTRCPCAASFSLPALVPPWTCDGTQWARAAATPPPAWRGGLQDGRVTAACVL